MSRYLRHDLIDWFDQQLLKSTKALVIGAGAIGNEVVKNLALLGVGAITIVDFDSIDGRPTQLFFLLVVPEQSGGQHLKALARIARLLRDPEICARLRSEQDPQQIFALLTGRAPGAAA